MSSGGGSTTTQSTQLPSWLEDAAKSNLSRADYVSQLGYVPQYGVDVAGFTPMQQSAMQNIADAASAFGLSAPTNAMAGMPAQQTNNLGFSGYSSGALYDDYLSNLAAQRPAQYEAINSMFIDPTSGQSSVAFTPIGSVTSTAAPEVVQKMVSSGDGYVMDSNGGFDAANPYASADAYNNAQKFNAWMKSQANNPLVGTSLLLQGLNLLNNNYLNSEAGMNASQGGSMLTTGSGSTGTVGQNNTYDPSYYNYSSGYDVGSGWGDSSSTGMADVQNTASSSDWGSYGSYGW
jgi:hypothetical protein